MNSVLFIAKGPEASIPAEMLLRREPVVVTRTESCAEARTLLNQAPFDLMVCAIDDLEPASRDCIDLLAGATGVPKVVVLLDQDLSVRSFEVDTRIVPIDMGLGEVRTAIRQQIRRAANTPQARTTAQGNFEFSFKFPGKPDRIAKARTVAGSFIQRCLNLSDRGLTQLELVLEEAICNAVYHGSLEIDSATKNEPAVVFKNLVSERLASLPYCERQVEVSLEIDSERLRITVSDEGPGFDREQEPSPTASTEPFGRGLMLMHAFADAVQFNETGNVVTLTIKRSSLQVAQQFPSSPTLQFARGESLDPTP